MVEETSTVLPEECVSDSVPGAPTSGPFRPLPKKPRLERTQDCAGSVADDAMDIRSEGDDVVRTEIPEQPPANTFATSDKPSSLEVRDRDKIHGLFKVRSHQDQAIRTQGQGLRLAQSSVIQKEGRTSMPPPSKTPQQVSRTHIDLIEERSTCEPFLFLSSSYQANQVPNNPITQAALNGQRLIEAVDRAALTTDPFSTARRHKMLDEQILAIKRQTATKDPTQKTSSHSERQTSQSAQSTSRTRFSRTARSSQIPQSQPTQTLATDSGSDTLGHRFVLPLHNTTSPPITSMNTYPLFNRKLH